MRDCGEVKKYLYVFLDDELTVQENVSILHHLEHCKSCYCLFEQEKQFQAAVKCCAEEECCPPEMGERMRASLTACCEEMECGAADGKRRRLVLGALSLAAAIVAVLGLASILGIFDGPQPAKLLTAGELGRSLTADYNVYLQGNKRVTPFTDIHHLSTWLKDATATDPHIRRVCVPNLCAYGYSVEGACYSGLIGDFNTTMSVFTKDGTKLTFFCFNVGGIDFGNEHLMRIGGKDVCWQKHNGATVILWEHGGCSHSLVSTESDEEIMAALELLINLRY